MRKNKVLGVVSFLLVVFLATSSAAATSVVIVICAPASFDMLRPFGIGVVASSSSSDAPSVQVEDPKTGARTPCAQALADLIGPPHNLVLKDVQVSNTSNVWYTLTKPSVQ